MVVYDTYAWVEYFRGSDRGAKVRSLLKEGGYTPSIVLAELARKYIREGFNEEDVLKRLKFIEAKTIPVNIDVEVALTAAKLYLELRRYADVESVRTPSLADAIVYATAKRLNDKLVTGDRLFKKLPDIVYIGD